MQRSFSKVSASLAGVLMLACHNPPIITQARDF